MRVLITLLITLFSVGWSAADQWVPLGLPKTNPTPQLNKPMPPVATMPAGHTDYFNHPAPDPRALQPQPLTATELQYARTAWAYFQKNTHPETGLVPSVQKFSSMTMWDQGGYLLALGAAFKLGLVDQAEATDRLTRVFTSLASLPLFKGALPNKAYNIKTLEMTDYASKPTPNGIGYSALDIMRLMSGLLVITQVFPEFTPMAQLIADRWDLAELAQNNRFSGMAILHKTYPKRVQEGRIGYEQYAGVTGLILGLPVKTAARFAPILRWQPYHGIHLPGDKRTQNSHGVSAVTTSEPFLLEILEYGWRPETFDVAWAVFQAHLIRHQRTGQLTALSEDHIKGKPYFAYNAVLVDFDPFLSVTASRKDVSDKRGLSAKASFGWWALTRHPYTFELLRAVEGLQTPNGWYAGLFEHDMQPNKVLTLNTNAVILEALHYKAFGPLYRM